MKSVLQLSFVLLLTLFALVFQGCSLETAPASLPVVTITFPPWPTVTKSSTPTKTPIQITTAPSIPEIDPTETLLPTTEPEPVSASVAVDVLNLRQGPGTVFDIVLKLNENTPVTVVSRAPGNEWVNLETQNGQSGWVSVDFLTLESDLRSVPVQTIDFAQAVEGQVVDESGDPIEAITIAVYQVAGSQTLRTDARTDEDGFFHAYLPLDAGLRWQIEVVGIGCSSAIVDPDCNYTGRFEPVGFTIDLPVVKDILRIVYIESE